MWALGLLLLRLRPPRVGGRAGISLPCHCSASAGGGGPCSCPGGGGEGEMGPHSGACGWVGGGAGGRGQGAGARTAYPRCPHTCVCVHARECECGRRAHGWRRDGSAVEPPVLSCHQAWLNTRRAAAGGARTCATARRGVVHGCTLHACRVLRCKTATELLLLLLLLMQGVHRRMLLCLVCVPVGPCWCAMSVYVCCRCLCTHAVHMYTIHPSMHKCHAGTKRGCGCFLAAY